MDVGWVPGYASALEVLTPPRRPGLVGYHATSLCPEAHLVVTLMSSLLGAITSMLTVVTRRLVSGRTMRDSALHVSVVGSNFRPLFHSVLLFPESQGGVEASWPR